MTAQGPTVQSKGASDLVSRLRAEISSTEDKVVQARLLHECGVLTEAAGEEPIAARDYLAAFNADPQFREPLESLVRILTRRKSVKNLGKLLDALTRAAESPEERSRAFWEYAAYTLEHEQSPENARSRLEEAVAAYPEDAVGWLELELIAAAQGDAEMRLRALEARAELTTSATWKGLLYIEMAQLSAAAGNTERAYELLDSAAALEGSARFKTRVVLEQIAVRDADEEVLARALEGQADLIVEALEEASRGDETGVPHYLRKSEVAADAWFRAAELRRRSGDNDASNALLNAAASRLPDSRLIARARLTSVEASGDAEGAAQIAKEELERGVTGPSAASLWLRIAEAAALSNDRSGAVDALHQALSADPACIPARALEIDLLGDGQDPAALAQSLESCAESFVTDDAKGRAYLMAAFVWAVRAEDVSAAKVALSQAAVCGVKPGVASRIARGLSAARSDPSWYEESTKRLLAAGAEAAEAPSLWFELGRSRLLRGDVEAAGEAFDKLGESEEAGASWLGRVLAACAVGLAARPTIDADGQPPTPPRRSPDAVESLALVERDPSLSRGLSVVAAMRAARNGDLDDAIKRLTVLHEADASDEVVAVYLAELLRRSSKNELAADTLSACAAAVDDTELGAALHLEAAILMWRAGNRSRAVEEIEASKVGAPAASRAMLSWALRGADTETLSGRRRALEAARDGGTEPGLGALERFALEVAYGAGGDGDGEGDANEALLALEQAEGSSHGDAAAAAALGRLLWAPATEHRDELERALDLLEDLGHEATSLARGERYRIARDVDKDPHGALNLARSWIAAEPSLSVALEWLIASTVAQDREAEVAARRMVAHQLDGDAKDAMEASAAVVAMLDQPSQMHRLLDGVRSAGQLVNLELAPPGCDPRRRAAALHGLTDTLGLDAQIDATSMAGWSDLAAGDAEAALNSFRAVVEARPDDMAGWEGFRVAAEALGSWAEAVQASAQLGALCSDDERGAEFWEHAGIIALEQLKAQDDAEIAFERAFERDARRGIAYDKLFRAVRARNEDEKLLAVIARRLDVSEDEAEIAKIYWERARVLRKKNDLDGALSALDNVTMLEPDHVGALALSGEMFIKKGKFDEAAPLLARLAQHEEAPKQQRLVSGVTAVDLYENKLDAPEKALEVLANLHKAGLSTLPVRERLAKAAAKTGAWLDAVDILEQLMEERESPEGRAEAGRLAMAIYRDKLGDAVYAQKATGALLEELPADGEALDLVLTTNFEPSFRTKMLGRGKNHILQSLARNPCNPDQVALLAKIAGAGQDMALRQATLGALVALGHDDPGLNDELARMDGRVAARPSIALDGTAMGEIVDPEDHGAVAELFVHLASTVSAAMGPSLSSLGVGRKERVDARGGHPLRLSVAEWMGALGVGDFDLYVGGPHPTGVQGVAGDVPSLVVGPQIAVPFDAPTRSAVAREVFALRRGITSVRARDDAAVASVVVAACNEVGMNLPNPGYAVYSEIQRGIHKEIPRKVKKAIAEICQQHVQSRRDPAAWAEAARRSLDRMSVIAAGDVSIVLSDMLNVPRAGLAERVADNPRARRLLAFVLSPSYLDLRKKLGMGVR